MSVRGESVPPPITPSLRQPRRKKLLALAFGAGVAVLLFTSGAAVMFFQLPPSDFLSKGFIGGRAWYERSGSSPQTKELDWSSDADWVDKPRKTYDGFTLCTFASTDDAMNTQAYLLDMRYKVKHRWKVPFSKIWPNPHHVPTPVRDSYVCFFGCHLYPNGDLLAVLHGMQQTVVGYGLVKLDKDSNILWKYAAGVHHDVEVTADGTIYAIQHETVNSMPNGLEFIPVPSIVDSLIVLSPKGELQGKPLPILEAFRDSPYATLLASLEPSKQRKKEEERPIPLTAQGIDEQRRREDALHTNALQVLTPALAQKFPGWKAGQVLITLRNLDAIAVVDLELRSVVWAARGPWQGQHDAQFLENGNLLLFDNQGLPKGSRVLEYNPRTQAFPWAYSGENWGPFYSSERGTCQRLLNGNTLVVNSTGMEILEVTPEREVVWSFFPDRFIAFARRYTADQVPFLPPGVKPRP
jgi:hypothetical protein